LKKKTDNQKVTIEFPNNSLLAILTGENSINLIRLERLLEVVINQFGNQIKISGDNKNINFTKTILTNLYNKLSNNEIEDMNLNFSFFETELRMFSNKSEKKENSNKPNEMLEYKFQT